MKTNLIYDGTFEGLLTSVFHVYEYKLKLVSIEKKEIHEASFFDDEVKIISDTQKAKRVWKGLSKKLSAMGKMKLYKVFLSEIPNVENTILYFIRKALASEVNIENDFGDPKILYLEQIVKKINREKHRMDAFVRFRHTKDGLYFATVEPDFDVLPLNASHFKNRYADQKWLIYDLKRNYGMFYNLEKVETVILEMPTDMTQKDKADSYFSYDELEFQKLWNNYFTSSNIASRKNMKLHIKNIPKRYWKYLSEKNF